MNDSKNSSKGLLVLRYPQALTQEQAEALYEAINPVAEALDVEPMVLPFGVDVELQMGSSALLERVCVALEEIAAQGRMPEVNVVEIAPQALNARPELDGRNGNGYQPVGGALNARPPAGR